MTMRIFRSITLSVLDYGAIVYNSASDTTKPLEVFTTEALRITSGAFKSTPMVLPLVYISCVMRCRLILEEAIYHWFIIIKSEVN